MTAFEPFINWNKVQPEQAEKIRELMIATKAASEELLEEATPEHAGEFMRTHSELNAYCAGVEGSLYVFPAIVHLAGEVTDEKHPEVPEMDCKVQRCSRCKSVLRVWFPGLAVQTPHGPREIEEKWSPIGERLGKRDYSNNPFVSVYAITPPDRPLDDDETDCVEMPDIDLPDIDWSQLDDITP